MDTRNPNRLLSSLLVLLFTGALDAQTFDSGSTGADGALTYAKNLGTVVFDPTKFKPPLDPEGDNVFHFTTITIGAGTTVRFLADVLGGEGKPVIFLSKGLVQIDGILNFNGSNGHNWNGVRGDSIPGAGGYSGGRGAGVGSNARSGNGPGGGRVDSRAVGSDRMSAGHYTTGENGRAPGPGGDAYGNEYLQPLTGGSGGAGGILGYPGGGAGGGAFLLASSVEIRLPSGGGIFADGGVGGARPPGAPWFSGSGSGGGIRLMAPIVSGNGALYARSVRGSLGFIRIETYRYVFTGRLIPDASLASPGLVMPVATAPLITVATIDGVKVKAGPSGSFLVPDVTIKKSTAATIALQAKGIPLGTKLQLSIQPEVGKVIRIQSTALTGTLGNSTATASAIFLTGYSRIFVKASW